MAILLPFASGVALGQTPGNNPVRLKFPQANQVVTGTVDLTLTSTPATIWAVDYSLGNQRLGRTASAPFSLRWNSASQPDGTSRVRMQAYDFMGRLLASDEVAVVLRNFANAASVTGLSDTRMSGTVPLTLNATDSRYFPAYWMMFIDGEQTALRFTDQAGVRTNRVTESLDTTKFPNGRSEFHFMFHSNTFGQPSVQNYSFRGMVTRTVEFDNGRVVMEIAPDYQHIYLRPGETVSVGCWRQYTNLDRDRCPGPRYTVADPAVASIAADGSLTARAAGFTTVTVSDGAKSAQAYVWVAATGAVPNFGAFLVAPFALEPQHLRDASMLAEARRAGVNTVGRGIYLNPLSLETPIEKFRADFDGVVMPDVEFARANGFRLLGSGDDICRRIGVEAWRTLNWRHGQQAVQYAIQRLASTGIVAGIEMVDEASALWGLHPVPAGRIGEPRSFVSISCLREICRVNWPDILNNEFHDPVSNGTAFALTGVPALETPPGTVYRIQNLRADGFDFAPGRRSGIIGQTFTAANSPALTYHWFAKADTCGGVPCNPPVPNDALQRISSWARSAASIPLSWPALGISLPFVQRNWMGKGSLSDYASHFWDSNQQRVTYIHGKGVRENVNSMLSAFYGRQPLMQLDRPQMLLQGINGPAYIKRTAAGVVGYTPPTDEFLHPGNQPRAIAAGIYAAAAAGAAGVRLYQFETPANTKARAGGVGAGHQTGAGPSNGEVANWRAMSYAANVLTKVLQPYLLGSAITSPGLGRNIVTGARSSPAGRMLSVTNAWDGARTLRFDLRPYALGGEYAVYRVSETGIQTAAGTRLDEEVNLGPGETAVYVFPSTGTAGLETVEFAPAGLASGSKAALRYGYVYGDHAELFGGAVDCTLPCPVKIDRRIGDVYYQLTVVNSAGNIIQRLPRALWNGLPRVTIATK